jgi:hypothetical protein
MSGLIFALALFGCTDDGSSCQRIASPATRYETREECLASQDAALNSDTAMAAEYPSVYAQCLTKSQLARLSGGDVDLRKVGLSLASLGE